METATGITEGYQSVRIWLNIPVNDANGNSTAGRTFVALSDGNNWFGYDGTWAAFGHNYGAFAPDGLDHVIDICCALDGSGTSMCLDGVLLGVDTSNKDLKFNGPLYFGGHGLTTNFDWPGSIGEIAVLSAPQITGPYTPTGQPTSPNTANLLNLWPLDSDGSDTALAGQPAVTPTVLPNDAGIVYPAGTFAVGASVASTVCVGNGPRIMFKGSASCKALFDLSLTGTVGNESWFRVNDRPPVRLPHAAIIDMTEGVALSTRWQIAEILYAATDSSNSASDRWSASATCGMYFQGFALDAGATTLAPLTTGKRAFVFGDSITEGYLSTDGTAQPAINDATTAFGYTFLKRLGYEPSVCANAGQGYTVAGNGGVPPLLQTWNLVRAGVPRSFAGIGMVVICHGKNDANSNVPAATVQAACTTMIANLLGVMDAGSLIVISSPISGEYVAALQAAVTAANSPRVLFNNATGFVDADKTDDGIHPLVAGHQGEYAPKMVASIGTLVTAAATPTSTSTDPGIANVKAGVAYEISGSALTGSYDPITGNYTDPGIAHVQKNVTYKLGGSTFTGTYDPVTGNYTNPGAASVAAGTTYQFAGATITGTLTVTTTTAGPTLAQFNTAITSLANLIGPGGSALTQIPTVGTVTNSTGVVLPVGAVAASPAPALGSFAAPVAGLNTTPGAYNNQLVVFQSGALETQRRVVTSYAVIGTGSAAVATFTFATGFTSAPAAGDSFVVI